MALSNYISQSVICSLVFYRPGFALMGQLERHQLYYVVAAIWAFNLLWSVVAGAIPFRAAGVVLAVVDVLAQAADAPRDTRSRGRPGVIGGLGPTSHGGKTSRVRSCQTLTSGSWS